MKWWLWGCAIAISATAFVAAQEATPPAGLPAGLPAGPPAGVPAERSASAKSPPPTTKVLNCTNGGCHAEQLDHKFLHGPTAVSACDACHQYQDPAAHKFEFKRPGSQLCQFCHIGKSGTEGPFVHEPVAKGNCTGCHDPHGSSSSRMLKKNTIRELCTECHRDVLSGDHVHKPAGEDCTACHRAHTAEHAKLLTMEARALCVSCHEAVGKNILDSEHPHRPAEGDCLQCHRPHASNEAKVLKAPVKELCISCHEPMGKTISAASHPHAATSDAKSCLNCHTAHASSHVKQLLDDPVGACLECHKKPIVVNEKRTVAAVEELAVASMHRHAPIQTGDCGGCHAVHGGERENLLVLPYSEAFYETFGTESYALCFKCHDLSLVTGKSSGQGTGFRDGLRNLHNVHVDRGPQGRSCRSCHTVHASRFETLIADSVTFGEWKLPINYVKTETGGSCAPGCHKPQSYDREKAVVPIDPASTAAPAPALAPTPTPTPTLARPVAPAAPKSN